MAGAVAFRRMDQDHANADEQRRRKVESQPDRHELKGGACYQLQGRSDAHEDRRWQCSGTRAARHRSGRTLPFERTRFLCRCFAMTSLRNSSRLGCTQPGHVWQCRCPSTRSTPSALRLPNTDSVVESLLQPAAERLKALGHEKRHRGCTWCLLLLAKRASKSRKAERRVLTGLVQHMETAMSVRGQTLVTRYGAG